MTNWHFIKVIVVNERVDLPAPTRQETDNIADILVSQLPGPR